MLFQTTQLKRLADVRFIVVIDGRRIDVDREGAAVESRESRVGKLVPVDSERFHCVRH